MIVYSLFGYRILATVRQLFGEYMGVPKIRVPYFGVLLIRIQLLRVLIRVPYDRKLPYELLGPLGFGVQGFTVFGNRRSGIC